MFLMVKQSNLFLIHVPGVKEPSRSLFVGKPSLDAWSELKSLKICFENEKNLSNLTF